MSWTDQEQLSRCSTSPKPSECLSGPPELCSAPPPEPLRPECLAENEEKPKRKRKQHFPATRKPRSKSWERPRGARGWTKIRDCQPCTDPLQQEEPAPNSQQHLHLQHSQNGIPKPLSKCAFCLGAPTGLSKCVCLKGRERGNRCAHCLGAPTGTVCTCDDVLYDELLVLASEFFNVTH